MNQKHTFQIPDLLFRRGVWKMKNLQSDANPITFTDTLETETLSPRNTVDKKVTDNP